MDYDNMPAGQDIDSLVAEKVMGWQRSNSMYMQWDTADGLVTWAETSFGSFRPSVDIGAALKVLEKVPSEWSVGMHRTLDGKWSADYGLGQAYADTAPLAICRAALKAMDWRREDD